MADRVHVDADHRREVVAPGTDDGRILDVRAELEAVLDVGRDVALAALGVDHLADAPQHDEMPVVLHVAGIARVQPTVGQCFARRLLVAEEAVEDAVGADQDFAVIRDLHLDARQRLADGVELDVAGALRGGQCTVLGLAVELLQVEPERSEEQERILADCLARGIGALGSG